MSAHEATITPTYGERVAKLEERVEGQKDDIAELKDGQKWMLRGIIAILVATCGELFVILWKLKGG
jgi:hypothetical protein